MCQGSYGLSLRIIRLYFVLASIVTQDELVHSFNSLFSKARIFFQVQIHSTSVLIITSIKITMSLGSIIKVSLRAGHFMETPARGALLRRACLPTACEVKASWGVLVFSMTEFSDKSLQTIALAGPLSCFSQGAPQGSVVLVPTQRGELVLW